MNVSFRTPHGSRCHTSTRNCKCVNDNMWFTFANHLLVKTTCNWTKLRTSVFISCLYFWSAVRLSASTPILLAPGDKRMNI